MKGVFAFEDIADDLPLLPLAARRALDVAGRRLSLAAWQTLSHEARSTLVFEGAQHHVSVDAVRDAIAGATPRAEEMAGDDERDLETLPGGLASMVADEVWHDLGRLERFALRHLARKQRPQRLREALAEIAPETQGTLTHLDRRGHAHMVDVSQKAASQRRAVARARVRLQRETAALVSDVSAPKGDVLATARIAGIMAAKRTSELIPLCHPIALSRVTVSVELAPSGDLLTVTAAAEAHDRTGVEMEAMTAASVAALTIYDMLKGVERGITIEQVVLLEKSGGRSGHYRREPHDEEQP